MRHTSLVAAIASVLFIALAGCKGAPPPPGGAAGANTTPRQNAETVEAPGRGDGANDIVEGEDPSGG